MIYETSVKVLVSLVDNEKLSPEACIRLEHIITKSIRDAEYPEYICSVHCSCNANPLREAS